ncbi:hypothetical protein CVT24_001142 [Panaeolus cyanescens]|uniref:Uncharacterized protein n=1 Tax=Panaeolus cyanescens TaxID=181874 RepID=A0A409WS74_9AGAR|nr:hypothetical protein CVT24_001142 [Panaeolus cyanescens]
MRFSSLFFIAIIAVSVTARIAVPDAVEFSIDPRGIATDAMLEPGKSKFFGGGDSSSDSESGGSTPSSPGTSRPSSPEPALEDDPNFDMGKGGEGQLARLGVTDPAERTAIENEHKRIVKEQMSKFDATRAEIEKLAHAKGSSDPKIHITATLYGYRKNKSGSMSLVTIPSSFAGEKGNFHHIYVNPANPADGLSVVKAKMPVYYAALQKKQGKKDPEI